MSKVDEVPALDDVHLMAYQQEIGWSKVRRGGIASCYDDRLC